MWLSTCTFRGVNSLPKGEKLSLGIHTIRHKVGTFWLKLEFFGSVYSISA